MFYFSIYHRRFCVGDRFYLCENKILCEYDYEERLVFASIGNHPMLKRHANNIAQNSPAFNKNNSVISHSASVQQHNMMAMEQAQATAAAVHQQQQQQNQQKLQHHGRARYVPSPRTVSTALDLDQYQKPTPNNNINDDLNNNSHGLASAAGCGISAPPYNSPHLKIPHST